MIRSIFSPENSRAVLLTGAVAFVLHIVLILSGSFDADSLKHKTILSVEHPPVSVSDSRKATSHPAFNNPAAGALDDIKEAEFELDFNAKSFDGFPNLFQTAPYNKGIRMEFGPAGKLALVVSRGAASALEGRILDCDISTGTWHHLKVTVSPDKEITVQIDNSKNAIPPLKASDINLDFSQIMAGVGFDSTRTFDGDVRDFTAKYRILRERGRLYPATKIALFILKMLLALMPMFVLWYFSWGPGSMSQTLAPGEAWPKVLAVAVFAVLTALSSAKYLFDGMETARAGLLSKLLPDLASVKFFTVLPNVSDPQFYIWGLPLLALSALVLFLARRDRIIAGAFVAAVTVFLLAVAGQLTAGLTALLLMLASYGIGRHICAVLGTDRHKDGFILPLVAGLSVNGIIFWIAAHFKVNYPVTHLCVLLGEMIVSYKFFRQLLGHALQNRRQELAAGQLAILSFALLYLPLALTPLIDWDGYIAHVYIAKQTALFGYFDFSPFYPYGLDQAIIPKGIYSPLFMLGDVPGIKIFVWFLFTLSFFVLEKLARERFGALTAFFSVLICMLTPSVLWQIQFVFIDVFEFMFGVILMAHAFNTFEDRSWKNLLLFFALSALSYYGKQSNMTIVIPLTMALAVMPLASIIRERDFRPATKFLAASLVCPVILAPSFWLNYHITGNPAFPYFNSVFKSFYFPVLFPHALAPVLDPWRLIVDITFQGARHCYHGSFNQAFGTWFYVLLPLSLWVLIFDRRNAREAFKLFSIFLAAAILLIYLIPPQFRYWDSALPVGAVLLALGAAKLVDFSEAGWKRWSVILLLSCLSVINLISTFQYPPRGIMPYPLRAIIMKEPIKRPVREPIQGREIMDYASKTYGRHSKALLYYSSLLSLANFHIEVYDWYNYRLTQELFSARKADVLYNIIFRINKFDFIILTDSRPPTNLDLLVSTGLIVPEYHVPGYTLYKPAGHRKQPLVTPPESTSPKRQTSVRGK